ncbi:MAG: tRNA (adenosine(37)-N6)-threonylcarbamoyltransferase complex ATPase subunit type 1 TsaE [Patescibacteria group bacterium]|nr:tRNA (adenosine(37)-N6)-threonylcarbamoyltransferase complex ATPase subunit type 1 TsaE [Patescibacteria group bacterium]
MTRVNKSAAGNGRRATITIGNVIRRSDVPDVAAWEGFADEVKTLIGPGNILAISGELGAGKTTFIQALSKVLGIKKHTLSPTFSLMRSYRLPRTYQGIKRIIHVDAYRFAAERELVVLDLDEEMADGSSVLVVEWPEKIPNWLSRHASKTVRIHID